jgi:hypothetical protein
MVESIMQLGVGVYEAWPCEALQNSWIKTDLWVTPISNRKGGMDAV